MPQTDKIHAVVRRALEKMGWEIVQEPLNLEVDDFRVFSVEREEIVTWIG